MDDEKEANIWVYDVAGTTSGRRLTYGGRNPFPIWSSDGRRIVYQSDREGDVGIFWQFADGTGSAERLTTLQREPPCTGSSSPDGKHLLFRVNKGTLPDSRGPSSLMELSLKDKKTTRFDDGDGRFAAFSPTDDGSRTPVAMGRPVPSTFSRFRPQA